MRINKFVARASGLSRRAADQAISEGRVLVNRQPGSAGADISDADEVSLDNNSLVLPEATTTIMLNKPAGYVCSRNGQGSQTIYNLLPPELHQLKPVGRLDKDSSGLLLLTNDGDLANQLTHPRYAKEKVYQIALDKPLAPEHQLKIEEGVKLDDGPSKLKIGRDATGTLTVTMSEGRNRQIRRTFDVLGYEVTQLKRVQFGPYQLSQLAPTQRYQAITPK